MDRSIRVYQSCAWASLEAILSGLQEVNDSTVETKVKATASGLLKKVKCFDFIASLIFIKNITLKTKFLRDSLQREELNIIEALEMTKATITSLEKIKKGGDGNDFPDNSCNRIRKEA